MGDTGELPVWEVSKLASPGSSDLTVQQTGANDKRNGGSECSTQPRGWDIPPHLPCKLLGRMDAPVKLPGLLTVGKENRHSW